MKLSKRIQQVGASETIAITARARQLQAQGIDVVSFAAGEPDFDTPAFIKHAAIAALNAGDTKYTPRSGVALVKAIADKLAKENGVVVEPDQVVVTFGGKHALYGAFQSILDEGDKVLIPSPYWTSYPEMVKLAGGVPVFLPSSAESGFKITPQQVLDHAEGAKVIVMNSPCNPTGVTYTPAELKAIVEAILETDLIVFSDEIYEKLLYGVKFVSLATLDARMPERTVTFNGLAKTFSMPGWRLGWAAGPKDLISSMKKLLTHETTNPVSFAQAGALAAYTDPQAAETIESMRQAFEKRGRHMLQRLRALPGVQCIEPTGAFYCFPDVREHFGRTLGGIEVVDSTTFYQAAMDKANIAVIPGSAFGEDNCIRLSFATSMEQIDNGLDRLEKLLK